MAKVASDMSKSKSNNSSEALRKKSCDSEKNTNSFFKNNMIEKSQSIKDCPLIVNKSDISIKVPENHKCQKENQNEKLYQDIGKDSFQSNSQSSIISQKDIFDSYEIKSCSELQSDMKFDLVSTSIPNLEKSTNTNSASLNLKETYSIYKKVPKANHCDDTSSKITENFILQSNSSSFDFKAIEQKTVRFFAIILGSEDGVSSKFLLEKLQLASEEIQKFVNYLYPDILSLIKRYPQLFYVSAITKLVYLKGKACDQ